MQDQHCTPDVERIMNSLNFRWAVQLALVHRHGGTLAFSLEWVCGKDPDAGKD